MRKITSFVKKNYIYLLLTLIICLQVALAVFWNYRREGLHVDEFWSFGLANSNYHPHIFSDDALDNGWIDSSYIRDYLVVDEDHRFDYVSVINNQKHDVHPPLFYIILHTVCSFFPGTFSTWFAVIPNLIFFALSLIILFKISKLLCKNDVISLVVVLFYGFSNAGISTAIYIRMYMLFTLFALSYIYIHTKMIVYNRQTVGNLIALSAVLFAGFMTHYYFIIIAFLVSSFYSLWLLYRKKFKSFGKYALFLLTPLLLVAIIYPTAYATILGTNSTAGVSNRGSEAIRQLLSISNLPQKLLDYFYAINNQLFGQKLKQILIILMLCAIIYVVFKSAKLVINSSTGEILILQNKVYRHSRKKVYTVSRNAIALIIIFASVAVYFTLMSVITPEYSSALAKDQYLYCIYPIVAIIFVLLLYYALRCIRVKHIQIASIIIVSIILIVQTLLVNPNHVYIGHAISTQKSLQHKGATCIFAAPPSQKFAVLTNAQELVSCSRIYPLWTDDGYINDDSTKNDLREVENESDVLIYVGTFNSRDSQDNIAERVADYVDSGRDPLLEFGNYDYKVYSL